MTELGLKSDKKERYEKAYQSLTGILLRRHAVFMEFQIHGKVSIPTLENLLAFIVRYHRNDTILFTLRYDVHLDLDYDQIKTLMRKSRHLVTRMPAGARVAIHARKFSDFLLLKLIAELYNTDHSELMRVFKSAQDAQDWLICQN